MRPIRQSTEKKSLRRHQSLSSIYAGHRPLIQWPQTWPTHNTIHRQPASGVGGERKTVASGRSRVGGTKQSHQKFSVSYVL